MIGVPDDLAGERPQAFVVRPHSADSEVDEEDLIDELSEYVQERLEQTHWLYGRVVFVAEIPKSGNGKVLKRILREMMTQI